MKEKPIYDMIIIGGGPGGYTAALYAARAGLNTIVLEKLSAGGQMALTHQIDNYPGFEDGVDGFELAERMQSQAERFGAETEYADVTRVDLKAEPKVRRNWWAGAGPTVPPATECSIRVKRWPWWAAATLRRRTRCCSAGLRKR